MRYLNIHFHLLPARLKDCPIPETFYKGATYEQREAWWFQKYPWGIIDRYVNATSPYGAPRFPCWDVLGNPSIRHYRNPQVGDYVHGANDILVRLESTSRVKLYEMEWQGQKIDLAANLYTDCILFGIATLLTA